MVLRTGLNCDTWIHQIHADTDVDTEFLFDEIMSFAFTCSSLLKSRSE